MKRLVILVLVLVCALGLVMFGMVACNVPRNGPSVNYFLDNKPSMAGIVKESNENAILIENETGQYWVALNTEVKDSTSHFRIGDEVVAYYDGNIAESYPMQINTVYIIMLKNAVEQNPE